MKRVPAGYSREVLLGSGRSGKVWRARQDDIGRMVALKEVPCRGAAEREALRREAAAIGQDEIPCLPRLHTVEFGSGRGWLVQEHVHGVALESLLKSGLEPTEARWLAGALVEAIAMLHRSGRSHGDLDPGHILLEPSGRLRLVDLGLSAGKTESVRGGSVGYLPPESGTDGADPLAGDVWSLGVLLHEILCGTRPGPRGPDREALARHGEWAARVESCLAPDPARRNDAARLLAGIEAREPVPQALLERVAVQADVELARLLKEGGREALSRDEPIEAWEYLQEAVNLDPDDVETFELLKRVRLGGSPRAKWPWIAALGAILLGLSAGVLLYLDETDSVPPRPVPRHRDPEDRLRAPGSAPAPLPLREGASR